MTPRVFTTLEKGIDCRTVNRGGGGQLSLLDGGCRVVVPIIRLLTVSHTTHTNTACVCFERTFTPAQRSPRQHADLTEEPAASYPQTWNRVWTQTRNKLKPDLDFNITVARRELPRSVLCSFCFYPNNHAIHRHGHDSHLTALLPLYSMA